MSESILLKGWLEKEKQKLSIIGGNTNRRYFKIEAIEGTSSKDSNDNKNHGIDGKQQRGELALCYYTSTTAKIPSGWLFLADVESIAVDNVGRWITLEHPSRCYRLKAPHHELHSLWYSTLSKLCYRARGEVKGTSVGNSLDDAMEDCVVDQVSKNITNLEVAKRELMETRIKTSPSTCSIGGNNDNNEERSYIGKHNLEAKMDIFPNLEVELEPTSTPVIEEEVARWYPNHSHFDCRNEVTVEDTHNDWHESVRHTQDLRQRRKQVEMKHPSPKGRRESTPSCTNIFGEDLQNYRQDVNVNNWKKEELFGNESSPIPTPTYNPNPHWNHVDHRLRRSEEFSETDETIHKRLGRAILSMDSVEGYGYDGKSDSFVPPPKNADDVMIVEEIDADDFNEDSSFSFNVSPKSRNVITRESAKEKRTISGERMARFDDFTMLSDTSINNRSRDMVEHQNLPILAKDSACIASSAERLAEVLADDSDIDETSVENIILHDRNENESITPRGRKTATFVCDDLDCSFLPDDDFVNEDWDD